MNKKGFTLIELLGAISILSILMGVAISAVTKYQIKARNSVYATHEKNIKSAALNYLLDNQGEIPNKNNSVKIDASRLIENQYLERLNDPVSKELDCNEKTYVIVKNNSEIENGNTSMSDYYDEKGNLIKSNTKNLDLEYKVCLICSDYKSPSCP
ncbi:MAG: type II secretion system protein [Bacilli bacterium]|nr:type II secretion system protein [Bacilli bacterium]